MPVTGWVEDWPGGFGRDRPHSGHGLNASSTAAPQKGHRPFGRWTLQAPQCEHG